MVGGWTLREQLAACWQVPAAEQHGTLQAAGRLRAAAEKAAAAAWQPGRLQNIHQAACGGWCCVDAGTGAEKAGQGLAQAARHVLGLVGQLGAAEQQAQTAARRLLAVAEQAGLAAALQLA